MGSGVSQRVTRVRLVRVIPEWRQQLCQQDRYGRQPAVGWLLYFLSVVPEMRPVVGEFRSCHQSITAKVA